METYKRKIIIPQLNDPERLARLYRERDFSRPPSISSGSYHDEEEEEEVAEEVLVEEEPAPILTLWEEVTEDYEKQRVQWTKSRAIKEIEKSERASLAPASVYLAREILPELIPALEDTLKKAEEANCLDVQKCRYNGIDNIAEYLWNKHSNEDPSNWLDVFDIPPFKEWLRLHPRPIFPLSWLWTPEEAALIIQRNVRGYFVRRLDDVQEMRQFWKAFRAQKKVLEERRKTVLLERELALLQQETESVEEDPPVVVPSVIQEEVAEILEPEIEPIVEASDETDT